MAQLLAALMNTLFAAGTVPLVYTIEKFGRRRIMMYSAVALTICMAIFVAMIGLENRTNATQWTAVAAIFVYNTVFGYGWIGVCWLYGPEVREYRVAAALTCADRWIDRAPQAQARWSCCWRIRRVALLLHYRLCWRYCAAECGLEDLDLDGAVLLRRHFLRLLHVPRGTSSLI